MLFKRARDVDWVVPTWGSAGAKVIWENGGTGPAWGQQVAFVQARAVAPAPQGSYTWAPLTGNPGWLEP